MFELFLLPFRNQPFEENIVHHHTPKGITLRTVIEMLLLISGIEANPGPPAGRE